MDLNELLSSGEIDLDALGIDIDMLSERLDQAMGDPDDMDDMPLRPETPPADPGIAARLGSPFEPPLPDSPLRSPLPGFRPTEEDSFASVSDACMATNLPGSAHALAAEGIRCANIAKWVFEHRHEVSFNRNDWHRISQSFNNGDYRSSLLLARAGLEFFPYDTTLLGDALQAAGYLAEWELGDMYLERALSIEARHVDDWYLPIWASEYRRIKARSTSPDQREELLQGALDYIRSFKEYLPFEDRIYNEEAEIMIEMNDLAGARRLLDDIIFEPHVNGEGIACHIMAPQCCITYLDSLLAGTDEYDRIIEVANVGIRCAATEERKVRVSYFLYRIALAKDCKIHSSSGTGGNTYGNQEQVRDALRSYALAYSMRTSEAYKETIQERFHILSIMSGIDDIALDQFCPKDDDE